MEIYTNIKMRPQHQAPSAIIILTPDVQVYIPEGLFPNVFVAEGPDSKIFLAADSQEKRAVWMNAIQGLETFNEGKLKPNAQCFIVKGGDSEYMRLIGCPNSDCILAIDIDGVQLADLQSKRFIIRWPLHCLRRYTCEKDEFTIFTGQRAPRGEGKYIFRSAIAEQIFSTLQMFINLKVQDLQQQDGSNPDPLENRPPAPLPKSTPPVSSSPPQMGEEQLETSMTHFESTDDLVPNRVSISSEGSEGYARTHHDLGPQFNQLQVEVGGAVAVDDGLYNTLQHMGKGKYRTWPSASVGSTYEMAKHPPPKTGVEPIYNVAYPTKPPPRDSPMASAAQVSQLAPNNSHTAMYPYQALPSEEQVPQLDPHYAYICCADLSLTPVLSMHPHINKPHMPEEAREKGTVLQKKGCASVTTTSELSEVISEHNILLEEENQSLREALKQLQDSHMALQVESENQVRERDQRISQLQEELSVAKFSLAEWSFTSTSPKDVQQQLKEVGLIL